MSESPRNNLSDRARRVVELGEAMGFALVGITDAQPSAYARHVRQWIEAGKHGQMHYLANHLNVRLDPTQFVTNAKAIICVADVYPATPSPRPARADASPTNATSPPSTSPRGRIARYAWGDDYHDIIKRRLFELADHLRQKYPQETFRCAVDTAPILEREHAAHAGLGWIGKHTLLLHAQRGSYLLLGMIVTTLRLQATRQAGYPPPLMPPADHCGTCTRCIDACPTQCIDNPAITGRRSLDAGRCISYLTLEHRDVINADLHEAMGDWIAGCDVCQEVCPYNQQANADDTEAPADGTTRYEHHPRYQPRPLAGGIDLLQLLSWTAEDRQRVFRGSALKRVKLDMLQRNALIAAGNALQRQHDPALLQKVKDMAGDSSLPDMVRLTAKQVLDAPGQADATGQRPGASPEADPH